MRGNWHLLCDLQWALIASRIKSILGFALDFYAIQQTLCSGGAAPAIKARCEMEVDRIEKQFDDCIAFLLRVFHFFIVKLHIVLCISNFRRACIMHMEKFICITVCLYIHIFLDIYIYVRMLWSTSLPTVAAY